MSQPSKRLDFRMGRVRNLLVVSDHRELLNFTASLIEKLRLRYPFSCDFAHTGSIALAGPDSIVQPKRIDLQDEDCLARIVKHYDLIFSVHAKSIFPPSLTQSVPCINVHPGFNPYNRGLYPHVFSILNGLPAGATIHLMDEKVDHGPIIDQIEVPIEASDTSLELYQRVLSAEKAIIEANLERLLKGSFETWETKAAGNLNVRADFERLCRIDLNQRGKFSDFLNLQRATSHGTFQNAYFLDDFGQKYGVKISIDRWAANDDP